MNLKSIYNETLLGFGIPQNIINEEWNFLVDAYIVDRVYHNINHIKKVVELLLEKEDSLSDPLLVRLAAFYHDVVYFPGDKKNELRSAMVFGLRLGKYLNVGDVIEVENLILSTVYDSEPMSEDAKYLVDADIASGLIGDMIVFNENNQKIIKEFSNIYETSLVIGERVKFLDGILKKEKLFHTEYFSKFETEIKNNITEYIK